MMISSLIFTSSCEKDDQVCYPGTITKNDTIFVGKEAPDYSISFNGDQQNLKVPVKETGLGLMNMATDYTVELWIKPDLDSTNHNKTIMRKWGQFYMKFTNSTDPDDSGRGRSGTNMLHINIDAAAAPGGFYTITTQKNVLVPGDWNHIAVINNSVDNTFKIFVNGVDVTIATANYGNNGEAITLKEDTNGSTNLYVGYGGSGTQPKAQYDDVRLLNVALSIDDLETSDVTKSEYVTDLTTAVLLKFDEGKGDETLDVVSNKKFTFFNKSDPKVDMAWVEL